MNLRCRELTVERGCPANAILIGNFLTPPVIEQVDLSAYHGMVSDVIRILAKDSIEVVSVTVTVRDADAASAMIEVTAQNRAGAKVTMAYPMS